MWIRAGGTHEKHAGCSIRPFHFAFAHLHVYSSNIPPKQHLLNLTCRSSADTPSGGPHLLAAVPCSRSYTPPAPGLAAGPGCPSSPAGQSSHCAPLPLPGRRGGGDGRGLKEYSINHSLSVVDGWLYWLITTLAPRPHTRTSTHIVYKAFIFVPQSTFSILNISKMNRLIHSI